MRDLYNSYKVVTAFAPVADPSGAGVAVDLQGYEGALFVFQSGEMGSTAGTYTWKLQECDTSGGSYTDVAAGDVLGGPVVFDQSVAADENAAKKLGYVGTKRFVKVYCTATGSATDPVIGATAILGRPRHAPVS